MKRFFKIFGIIFVLAILGLVSYLSFGLPNVGPPEEITIDRTEERIERGKYLANHVTVCMDCHSQRDKVLFSAPLVDGTLGMGGELFDESMGFPGKIYSPNITPHALSDWTDGEIVKAITTGQSKDGRSLFPVMAYGRFGQMDKEDILSIVAYIRSIEPHSNTVPVSKLNFPVNLLINTMPQKAVYTTRPSEKDTVLYGGYLINAAGCVDCHSKTDNGVVIAGTEFGGGMEFAQPAGVIAAPNITMHPKNGIGSWSKELFVQKFKVYQDPNFELQKMTPQELNTPMPWVMYAGMKESDLEAIYAYLKSLKPIDNAVEVRVYKNK